MIDNKSLTNTGRLRPEVKAALELLETAHNEGGDDLFTIDDLVMTYLVLGLTDKLQSVAGDYELPANDAAESKTALFVKLLAHAGNEGLMNEVAQTFLRHKLLTRLPSEEEIQRERATATGLETHLTHCASDTLVLTR